MTVGSRSFEHPINGTTRRRLSGLVDIGAGSNAPDVLPGKQVRFCARYSAATGCGSAIKSSQCMTSQKMNSDSYFHPGIITLGKKGDSGSGAPAYSTAASGVAVYTTYESVIEAHHSSMWKVETLTVTDEGRITGSFLGHGSLVGSKPVYCPYKSRNIICRDDTQASGVLAPYTTHYRTGWEQLETIWTWCRVA